MQNAIRGCSVVYHAAGFPEQWMRDPAIFHRVNVEGTEIMIRAALEASVQPLIPKGQLHFLQWQAPPDGTKAIRELGLQYTPVREGLRATIRAMQKTTS